MTMKRRFTEESESEEYLHKTAWSVVLRQIEHAEATPHGVLYDYLVAMVFAFHSLEGYLNFVGDKIAPELWADERETFKNTGLFGKLAAIRCPDHFLWPSLADPIGIVRDNVVRGDAVSSRATAQSR
jgi:hypothetical protein